MAVTIKGSTPTYQGLSTDDKPEEPVVNAFFEELDTGDIYYFDGETWAKVGAKANEST